MGESGAVVVNPVVKVLAPGPALTELSDLLGLGANSNHRADLVRVPDAPAALGSGHDSDHDAEAREQRREQGDPEEQPARPSEVSRSKRDHAERLEAASVLDAPASLHESTPPPSRKPWAMYLWASLMVSIIGAAGVVAYKEQRAGEAGAAAVVPEQPALRAAELPEHADAIERAPRAPRAEAAGVSAVGAVLEIPQPEVPGKPASEAPNVMERVQAAEASKAGQTVAADEDEAGDESAESAARAGRRAARRQAEANGAAENADAMTAGKLASQAAFEASRITMGVAAPSVAPLLDEGVRDPRPNANSIVPVLPSNPYDADDVPAKSSP